jgi:hypothetical protein
MRVAFDRGTAFIYGPKAEVRRRIEVCGDHGPIWVKQREAWATSPTVANRVLDQLEGRVVVPIDDSDQDEIVFTESVPGNHDTTPAGLW